MLYWCFALTNSLICIVSMYSILERLVLILAKDQGVTNSNIQLKIFTAGQYTVGLRDRPQRQTLHLAFVNHKT